MSIDADSRLTRTAQVTGTTGSTGGTTRTRYSTTRQTTVLAVRGVHAWRRIARALADLWRRITTTVTPAGWLMLAVAAAGLALGLAFGWIEFVVAGLIALVLLVLSVPFLFRGRAYEVDLVLEHDRVVAGTAVQGALTVRTTRGGIVLPGRVDVPVGEGLVDVFVPMLRPGQVHAENVVIPTHRRGIITVGPVRTVRGDPLGILARETTWADTHTLYVHPVTTALRSTNTGFIRDLEGSASRTVVDADISFHAIREYAPGDSPRQIHWKSTAKTGTLMVRQYEETRRSRMVVVLGVADAEFAGDDEFEMAVSAVGSLGVRGIRDGRDVDVMIGGEVPEFARRAVRSLRELATVSTRTLLDDLAGVDRAEFVTPLADVAELAREARPDVSVAILVCGSTLTARDLQHAAMAFPPEVSVLAVVCNPEAEPGMRTLGSVSVLSIGLLDDLRHLLARGAQS